MKRTAALENFYSEHPWYDVMANDSILLSAVPQPVTLAALKVAAIQLARRLVIAPDYANAWTEFTSRHPEYTGHGASGNQLLAYSLLNPYEPPTVEAFEAIALRQDRPLVWNTLVREAAQDEATRQELIKEISQGKPTFGIWSKAHGQVRYVESASLAGETTENLRAIRDSVVELRRVQSLSKQDQRSELHKQVKEQRADWQAEPTDIFLAHPSDAKREWTSVELKLASRETLRALLFFPSGRPRPGASAAVTRILKAGTR
jgi:hypothetical protein